MTQANLPFVSGRDLRDAGMHQAVTNADDQNPNWSDEAMMALKLYLMAHPDKEFMTEDLRAYAYDVLAIPYPPHCRAWGAIIAKAAREGLIERVRIAPVKTPSSHMANASVWRAT